MAVDLTHSMSPEKLYVCAQEVRIKGSLADGREAFSLIPEGTPVVLVAGKDNAQAILVDGAVVPFKWSTPGWRALFREADSAEGKA